MRSRRKGDHRENYREVERETKFHGWRLPNLEGEILTSH
jgi:hypothetical protein